MPIALAGFRMAIFRATKYHFDFFNQKPEATFECPFSNHFEIHQGHEQMSAALASSKVSAQVSQAPLTSRGSRLQGQALVCSH